MLRKPLLPKNDDAVVFLRNIFLHFTDRIKVIQLRFLQMAVIIFRLLKSRVCLDRRIIAIWKDTLYNAVRMFIEYSAWKVAVYLLNTKI